MHWAAEYIGKPWVSGGRGPHSFDCWGLFRDVYRRRLGIELPLYGIDPSRRIEVSRAFGKAVLSGQWVRVEEPCEYDAVALGGTTAIQHVGLFIEVDRGRVLHADEPRVTAIPLDRLPALGYGLIRFYRHADNT